MSGTRFCAVRSTDRWPARRRVGRGCCRSCRRRLSWRPAPTCCSRRTERHPTTAHVYGTSVNRFIAPSDPSGNDTAATATARNEVKFIYSAIGARESKVVEFVRSDPASVRRESPRATARGGCRPRPRQPAVGACLCPPRAPPNAAVSLAGPAPCRDWLADRCAARAAATRRGDVPGRSLL